MADAAGHPRVTPSSWARTQPRRPDVIHEHPKGGENMEALIIGGTGLISSAVVRQLAGPGRPGHCPRTAAKVGGPCPTVWPG